MKEIIVCFLFLVLSNLSGQEKVENFIVVNEENNVFDLYNTLDSGYFVIVHFFTTWSEKSRNYIDSGILSALAENAGKQGADLVRIVHFEVDEVTSWNDIEGIGGNTIQDWKLVTNSFLANPEQVDLNFEQLLPNGLPTVLMIHPESKTIVEDLSGITEQDKVFEVLEKYGFSETLDVSSSRTELSVYPNPAQNYITISSTKNIEYLEIYNLAGSSRKSIQLQHLNQLPIHDLTAGMYFIKAVFLTGELSCVRFIKN